MGITDVFYLKDFERGRNVNSKSLTSELDRDYIQHLIVLRDLKNNGMTRGEVIGLIQKMTCASFETAEQHWYYCRRAKLMPELKNHGALRTAQATTTKRSGITTEKLLRWHGTIEDALHELDRLNSWHADWEGIKNSNKIDSFLGNMDETNMSAAEGATKVVASKYVKKQQMNKDDNRGTITIARCGLASGVDGPRFFLVKAEKIDLDTFKGNFSRKHSAPTGSQVIATPNAYMTDKVWNQMSKDFAAGLRALPIVRGYPDLWMVLTLDGFGSHLQGEALKVFADYKILIVKEEGDTLQVCQAYDKDVAKEDKRHHRSLLNGIRMQIHMVDQWTLVLVANKALNKIRKNVWGDSHHLVNLRPSTRVPFTEYVTRVKEVVDAGDYFYYKRQGMFDAMPACWKQLCEAQRREVAALIGSFYDESRANPDKDPWAIDNLKKYLDLGYVKLDEMPKFRAAYLATRGDESIFADPPFGSATDDDSAAGINANGSTLLDQHDGFALKPKTLVEQYQANPGDSKAQGKLFVHMTNFVSTEHALANKKADNKVQLEPTSGLNVELTVLQKCMLNPTVRDIQVSEIVDQAQGERAKKKEAKRRQDFMTGNIGSYSGILNSEKNLKMVQDYNELTVSIAMLNAEKEAKAKAVAKKKVEEAKEKAKKKAGKEVDEVNKRNELLPQFEQELQHGDVNRILTMSDKRMREYICYFFQKKVVNLTKTKKDDLKAILSPLLYQHFLASGTTLELVAEMTAGTTGAATFVEAENNALTAPA